MSSLHGTKLRKHTRRHHRPRRHHRKHKVSPNSSQQGVKNVHSSTHSLEYYLATCGLSDVSSSIKDFDFKQTPPEDSIDLPTLHAAIQIRELLISILPDDLIGFVFQYFQDFSLIGTFRHQFGGFGTRPGEFHQPFGMTHDDLRIYVCDTSNSRIQVFDYHGGFITLFGEYGNKLGQFKFPRSLLVLDNHLWISDTGNQRLQVLTKNGKYITHYPLGFRCSGLAHVNTEPNLIYICDLDNQKVVVYDRETKKIVRSWGREGAGSEAVFSGGYYFNLAVDRESIYVTDQGDHCVRVYTHEGHVKATWGGQQLKVTFPYGIMVDDDQDEVYIGEMNHVKIVNKKNGNLNQVIAWKKEGCLFEASNWIAALFRHRNKLYMLDSANHRVQIFQ